MKKRLALTLASLLLFTILNAQIHSSPKLFVGIVVDQMRAEYLYRFYDQYSENGFKRLINEGFNCRNVHINYIPTITGPGHASIYAGTTPKYHGIVGNAWYDRQSNRVDYCVEDTNERIVGRENENFEISAQEIQKSKSSEEDNLNFGISPRNLLSTNISDELKISTNQKSKVIGISLKDRAAALPAGHMADGAFWLDHKTGNFVSSTYYIKKLPDWVINFNNEKKAFKYLENTWKLMLPEDSYPLSVADDNNYETILKGKDRPVFPYNLKELASKNGPYFEVLNISPFGNTLLTDLAIAALQNAGLGKSGYTDLLTISFSSTDAVGHTYGPMSKELNDTYLRLDQEIARLLEALDKYIGKGNYSLFLTADHGMSEAVKYLQDFKIPANKIDSSFIENGVANLLNKKFGQGKWILYTRNEQFYLNRKLINEKGLDLTKVQNQVAEFLRNQDGIAQVYTATQLDQQEFTMNLSARVQNGFYYKRSGDVKFVLEPGWTNDYQNATHSSGYTYDTHVPLIWYGAKIKRGESFTHYNITDIAPTVSMMLHIKLPSACTGNPISEVILNN